MREYARELEFYGREKLSLRYLKDKILADIDPHVFTFQESLVGKFARPSPRSDPSRKGLSGNDASLIFMVIIRASKSLMVKKINYLYSFSIIF